MFLRNCFRTGLIMLPYLAGCTSPDIAEERGLLPVPNVAKHGEGAFTLSSATPILMSENSPDLNMVAQCLREYIAAAAGMDLQIAPAQEGASDQSAIVLRLLASSENDNAEAYKLQVGPEQIVITANAFAGLFYGVQTLRQLLPANETPTSELLVPAIEVEDSPRFKWRGAMLDVCRHFFPKSFVKKFIDLMAMHKLNTFHWHLTEDQGWRIEIDKYPKLTEIGAWRADRGDLHWNERPPQADGEPATYGGFYTKEDIREIVAYAAERFITVVPEIEMPGHAVAALAAHPELSCTGGPYKVMTGGYWPITDIYCAGNEQTFTFLEDVLSEVVELFPGEYVHIGGDEAQKMRWKACEKCQTRMREEHLASEEELQSWFIRRIEKFLNAKGKRLIGWDEILEGGLAPNATVMSWRGTKGGIAAAIAGHDVVMAPTSHCYFDYYQAEHGEPLAIGGLLPLEKVYAFEPVPKDIPADRRHHVIGAQANLWTEYISTPDHAEYMAFPRLSALAEVAWSAPKNRSYDGFLTRLDVHLDRLAAAGVNFRVPPPGSFPPQLTSEHPMALALLKPFPDSEIYYTLDGSEPSLASPRYQKPLRIDGEVHLRAKTVLRNGRESRTAATTVSIVDPDKNGILFEIYKGIWEKMPDLNSMNPDTTGKCYTLTLDAAREAGDNYALRFSSLLDIREAGEYAFSLGSNGPASLAINGTPVVVNSAGGRESGSGSITLDAGQHQLLLDTIQRGWTRHLELSWNGPGVSPGQIPAGRLVLRR